MKLKGMPTAVAAALAIAAGFGGGVATPAAQAGEVMTDRCSQEVAFVPKYNEKPTAHGTIILKRGADGSTAWTPPFSVDTGDDGHVRWWCHSTTGNAFDPGTWRVSLNAGGVVACLTAAGETVATEGAGAAGLAACEKTVNIGSSAFKGWTAERSRCGTHSGRIRARLGPDRLLQTECLGD